MTKTDKKIVLQPYRHDCDACVWVSWVSWTNRSKPANMYLCQGKTIIIRFSDEPSDYWSMTAGEAVKDAVAIFKTGDERK